MEKERGTLLKTLGTQVAEPLRAMVMGAPPMDAQHLAQWYDRMRQEAEAQTIEVSKRQAKEYQQQNKTLQRLITLVETERSYHQRFFEIIEQIKGEMRFEQQTNNGAQMHNGTSDAMGYFLGEVMFLYQADSDFGLSLPVGDYVVIREVVSSGWAERVCKGKAGWFPYDYIERRDRVLSFIFV